MRLIATDLDGTLLDSSSHVSPRTRRALDAARERGIHVVPVTARQPIGLRVIAADAAFDGWALCSNGAYAVHLTDKRMLFAEELPAETIRTLAEALRASIPGLLFASVRDGGETFVAQEGYSAFARPSDHSRDPALMGGVDFDDVVSAPSLKFIVRHAELAPAALFDTLRSLGLTGFEATLSGAPFVEVMAEGVTKATGLARLCAHLDIDRADVVAFGDALNDVEMLRWAGHGVAMADAATVVQDAADETTTSNDDHGVARVIERMLG
ncbi:Cof-type HAD-IIB family hydrolase [Microbacterium sp. W4I20]|uniref:Cof-type HAD-IIB family hydrolase n=1 Tax=Microbacterium sp. W4I20 TaxID=3042262 RepID=UPI00277EAC16|nr:HAD family hydrolase [Microbacterium sp. W4I20]MDQ0728053.1 Cof subfamily protein (haloacid dehalogenase superfamily) [Microbacterium sp. W4I20]